MQWKMPKQTARMRKRYTVKDLRLSFRKALKPPPDLTIDIYADKYRMLTSSASSEAGKWRTSRFPFLREIMQELSPQSNAQQVVVMKGAQLGFTEIAINWMFYNIDYRPAPMLYVQKTIDAVEKFSLQRFAPSVESCSRIQEKLRPDSTRDANNTKRMKSFTGGIIMLGGANSAASLRSMPIQDLILDEEDSYEGDIEGEGSPSYLAIARTRNFPRRKIYRISTPTIKETSIIEPLFVSGDQRRYYVPCPHCKQLDWIRWENIVYGKKAGDIDDNIDVVKYKCSFCNELIDERYKTWMLDPANGAKWVKHNPEGKYPSYHISSLYSPLGFFSWQEAVAMFVKAEKEFDRALLKVFINTVLGETFTETGKSVDSEWLSSRKEEYSSDVPMNARILSAGVDVQEDRIECEIVGWGKNQESWSIDYSVFRGDTESTFVWQQLYDHLRKAWKHESGRLMTVAVAAIDSGHRARVVYNFCKPREAMRYFPVKGRDGWGKGYIDRPKARNKDGVYLFLAFVDEVKSKIYSQLQLEEHGAGFCHFPRKPAYDHAYFRMLTSERLEQQKKRGRSGLVWVCPAGRRNEALDCRVYALCALTIISPNFDLLELRGDIISGGEARRTRKRRAHSSGV